MFGYVKAYRSYLRVCELDLYKGIYCGLCKTMTRRSGFVSSLTLSYDFVFLTIIGLGVKNAELTAEKRRCPLHPIRKTACVRCTDSCGAFEYSADSAAILTYHKLRDDLRDKGLKSRLAAAALLPFYIAPYKRAAAGYPALADTVGEAVKAQSQLERLRESSLDRAAEPTAVMMRAVFRELAGFDPELRDTLGRFGYMLGRYVYICDALDDLAKDSISGDYNPFLDVRHRGELSEKEYKRVAAEAKISINLTLGELSEAYSRLELGGIKPLADNIVYLGLKRTFMSIVSKSLKRLRADSERRK